LQILTHTFSLNMKMDSPALNDMTLPESKTPIIVIGIISLIVLIIYGVIIYIMQKQKAGPFKDYTPPDLVNGARPGGGLMDATLFAQRQAALQTAVNPTT
jgi:hypothetical protein